MNAQKKPVEKIELTPILEKHIQKIAYWMYKKETSITYSSILVMSLLLERGQRNDALRRGFESFSTQDHLARLIGVTPLTIANAKKELLKHGFLIPTDRYYRSSQWKNVKFMRCPIYTFDSFFKASERIPSFDSLINIHKDSNQTSSHNKSTTDIKEDPRGGDLLFLKRLKNKKLQNTISSRIQKALDRCIAIDSGKNVNAGMFEDRDRNKFDDAAIPLNPHAITLDYALKTPLTPFAQVSKRVIKYFYQTFDYISKKQWDTLLPLWVASALREMVTPNQLLIQLIENHKNDEVIYWDFVKAITQCKEKKDQWVGVIEYFKVNNIDLSAKKPEGLVSNQPITVTNPRPLEEENNPQVIEKNENTFSQPVKRQEKKSQKSQKKAKKSSESKDSIPSKLLKYVKDYHLTQGQSIESAYNDVRNHFQNKHGISYDLELIKLAFDRKEQLRRELYEQERARLNPSQTPPSSEKKQSHSQELGDVTVSCTSEMSRDGDFSQWNHSKNIGDSASGRYNSQNMKVLGLREKKYQQYEFNNKYAHFQGVPDREGATALLNHFFRQKENANHQLPITETKESFPDTSHLYMPPVIQPSAPISSKSGEISAVETSDDEHDPFEIKEQPQRVMQTFIAPQGKKRIEAPRIVATSGENWDKFISEANSRVNENPQDYCESQRQSRPASIQSLMGGVSQSLGISQSTQQQPSAKLGISESESIFNGLIQDPAAAEALRNLNQKIRK